MTERYAARRAALAGALGDRADAYLITKVVNVRYLTGFTGSNAALLVTPEGSVLATDGRYETQATAESPDVELLVAQHVAPALGELARDRHVERLAVEHQHVTMALGGQIAAAAGHDVHVIDVGPLVEDLRAVKDADEIALLRKACGVTDEVFTAVLRLLRPGVTERAIDWELRRLMHERDAVPAFDSIVAFGANSAEPHHHPTDRPLAAGDLVKLDFGAAIDGYHADMTRTVVCGTPGDWQRELHELVREIQAEARDEVRPGAVPMELDTDMRFRIEATGHAVAHGLGHGVGLEIHESPLLVRGSTAARLVDRVVVTVEPGIYLPGRGGVRIEDTVLVGAAGAEPLTASPRELISI